MRRSLEVASVAVAAAALGFAIQWWGPFGMRDEAYQYLMCREWARGVNLFTAFRLHYLHGSFALGGSFMALLGEGVWVLRLFNALLGGAAAALAWLAVRPASGSGVAWTVAMSLPALGLGGLGPPAVAAAAWAWGAAAVGTPRRRLVWGLAFAGGVLGGWREDAAVMVVAASIIPVLRGRSLPDLTLIPTGIAAGLLPWLGAAAGRGELREWLVHASHRYGLLLTRLGGPGHADQGWQWPQSIASPVDVATALFPLLAVVPPIVYGVLLVRQGRKWQSGEPWSPRLVAVTVASLPWLAYYLVERRDIWHFRGQLPLLLIVIGVGLAEFGEVRRRWAMLGLGALAVVGATMIVAQKALVPRVLYPSAEAARIGVWVAGELPPWAGLAREPGETLIVLPWGVGWNLAEGLAPGSSVVAGYAYHLAEPGAMDVLLDDLREPSNRWLILESWLEGERDSPWFGPILTVIREYYRPVAAWREWRVWEHSAAGCDQQEVLPAGTHHPGGDGKRQVGDQTGE